LNLNFTNKNPFEDVPRRLRKKSIGLIDANTQENYFAELDKDLESTPDYNDICTLRSMLRENKIKETPKISEPERTTCLSESCREGYEARFWEQNIKSSIGFMGGNLTGKEGETFLIRNESHSSLEVDKDGSIYGANEYLRPDDFIKRPSSSPGNKSMMQIFEKTVTNVQHSSFHVDYDIPLETYPMERTNLFVDSQGYEKFTCLFGENCKLDMFRRAQYRDFNSQNQHNELSWEGDYEFITIGSRWLGLGVQHIDQEFSRLAVTFINRKRPNFLVICGDLVDNLEANWPQGDLKDGRRKRIKWRSTFKKIYSKVSRHIPVIFVIGNYDVESKLSKARLQFGKNQFGGNYFTFWAGGVKFIVLNSEIIQKLDSSDELSIAHEKWLNKELTRQHRKKPVHLVVFCHIPPFCFNVEEKNTKFNWPRSKRVILLDKMVDANVKKIYCAHFQRRSRRVYKGLEIVVSEPIGTIYNKPIPKQSKGSRLKDVNFRSSLDASVGIKTSEDSCRLQVVTVSRNNLSEQWLSVPEITKTSSLSKATKLNTGLVLSKFVMRTEFVPSAHDTCAKITADFPDEQRAQHTNISDKSYSDNKEFQQTTEGENFSNGQQFQTASHLNEKGSLCFTTLPPDLTYSLNWTAACERPGVGGTSQNSRQQVIISSNSKSTNDSTNYRRETKESTPTGKETEKFIFAKKAVQNNIPKSVKSSALLPRQSAYSNENMPQNSSGKDWTLVNSNKPISHLQKMQSSRVDSTKNPKQSKMKLQAKLIKTGGVTETWINRKAAQPPKVAEWSVHEVLGWLTQLNPNLRKYHKVFYGQRIDGRRLLVLKGCDLLYQFTQNREDVALIIRALEKLAPTPPEFSWASKDGSNYQRFKIKELMHIGEFSTTHQAFDLNNGNRICALKLVSRKKVSKYVRRKQDRRKQNLEKLVIREIALKMFFSNNPSKRHENMVSYYGYYKEVRYRGAMYDWIVVREHHLYDLGLLTENRVSLGEDISRRILHQLVSLLCFFREWKVGHFDLQPKNLLVQEEGWIIKVAGWSNYRQFTKTRVYNDAARSHIENRSYYMAPELYERREYGLSADSWSVGAVLYNLITGYLPFNYRTRADPAYNALRENNSEAFWNANMERTRGLIVTTKSIVFNLLKFNAEERLDIENVKYEKYFQGILQSDLEYSSGMKNHFTQLKWRLD